VGCWRNLCLLIGLVALLAAPRRAPAKIDWEPPQQVPTAEDRSAWFPGMVVDQRGRVHLIWSDTAHGKQRDTHDTPRATRAGPESLDYSIRENGQWSPPRSIAVGQPSIYRHSLAIDSNDMLHLLFRYRPGSGLTCTTGRRRPRRDLPKATGSTRASSIFAGTRIAATAARGDTLPLVFDDMGSLDRSATPVRISTIAARPTAATWSAPLSLRPSLEGGARAHLRRRRRCPAA
jgi:hypothetical protein